jgi:hypothetical protein
MDEQEAFEKRQEAQREQEAASVAGQAATSAAREKLSQRVENPEFFAQLRDADLDTEEHHWVSDLLGPKQSGAHLIGNRSEEYEAELKWGGRNEAERLVTERSPGRLCKGKRLELAHGVTDRNDAEAPSPATSEQRRVIRDGMDAVTNYQALAINNQGLKSVTEATAVSKVEKNEEESSTVRERAAGFLG